MQKRNIIFNDLGYKRNKNLMRPSSEDKCCTINKLTFYSWLRYRVLWADHR